MQRADGVYYFWDFAYNYTHMLRSYPSASQIMMLRASPPPLGIYENFTNSPSLKCGSCAPPHALKKFTPLPPEFFNNCCRRFDIKLSVQLQWIRRVRIYKNKHFRKPNSALMIIEFQHSREKKIDLYSTMHEFVQNTLFGVCSEHDLCNRLSFHRSPFVYKYARRGQREFLGRN